jgi:hypothetical protein
VSPSPSRAASGVPYTSPQNIRGVTEDLQRVQARFANELVDLKKATDAELDQAISAVQQDVGERDAELRDGLRYVLAGSVRERAFGAVLLLVGIVLATVGSVLGNLS